MAVVAAALAAFVLSTNVSDHTVKPSNIVHGSSDASWTGS